VQYVNSDAHPAGRQTGAVILRREYFPFAEGVGSDGGTSLGFTGQEGDPESGLNYVGGRYYRAWTGRFTSADPVFSGVSNPQAWNRYADSFTTLFSKNWRQSCLTVFMFETLNQANPMQPDWLQPFANGITAVQYNRALNYAASRPNVIGGRGLLFPFKSRVFGGLLARSRLTSVLSAGASLALAEVMAISKEWEAANAGLCR